MRFGLGIILYPLLCGFTSLLSVTREPSLMLLALNILKGNKDILYCGKVALTAKGRIFRWKVLVSRVTDVADLLNQK